MSTQLLASPGKVHELCDDLESLWFVLLFESLHFVKHNEPKDIRMAAIFDQVYVDPKTGEHTGGDGKISLYSTNPLAELKFDSKPFTTLIRRIYLLFQSLNAYYVDKKNKKIPSDSVKNDVRKLGSCEEIRGLLVDALRGVDWPLGDKVPDQYPPLRRMTPEQKATIALSYACCELSPPSTPSGGKRKREEEDCPLVSDEVKRPKIGLPLWRRVWGFLAG